MTVHEGAGVAGLGWGPRMANDVFSPLPALSTLRALAHATPPPSAQEVPADPPAQPSVLSGATQRHT